MSRTKALKLLVVLFMILAGCATVHKVSANGIISGDLKNNVNIKDISIVTDRKSANVTVTIDNQIMNGQTVSVVCYSPGYNGDAANLAGNIDYVEYIGQTKVDGSAYVFPIKGNVQTGEYTLVMGCSKGKIVKTFSFNGNEKTMKVGVMNVRAVQAGPKSVRISWTKMRKVPKYIINRSNKKNGPFHKIGTSKTGTYIDRKVKAGKTYYYEVIMQDNQTGNNPVKVTLMKTPVIKTKAAKKLIRVRWKKDKCASGYRVYISARRKGGYRVAATINKNRKVKAKVRNLKKGKKYYVKVCAYRNNGKRKVFGKASAVKRVKVK